MVPQPYSVLTSDAHVMLSNSVTMACTLPSHVTEFVSVLAWRVEERGQAPLSLKHQHRYGSLGCPQLACPGLLSHQPPVHTGEEFSVSVSVSVSVHLKI